MRGGGAAQREATRLKGVFLRNKTELLELHAEVPPARLVPNTFLNRDRLNHACSRSCIPPEECRVVLREQSDSAAARPRRVVTRQRGGGRRWLRSARSATSSLSARRWVDLVWPLFGLCFAFVWPLFRYCLTLFDQGRTFV